MLRYLGLLDLRKLGRAQRTHALKMVMLARLVLLDTKVVTTEYFFADIRELKLEIAIILLADEMDVCHLMGFNQPGRHV